MSEPVFVRDLDPEARRRWRLNDRRQALYDLFRILSARQVPSEIEKAIKEQTSIDILEQWFDAKLGMPMEAFRDLVAGSGRASEARS